MAKDSEEAEPQVGESRMDAIKGRLKDAGQKVGNASKKVAKKTSDLGSSIAESSVAKDIAAGAKKVGDDVKVASAKVSETVDKKREEFKERRDASKAAKAQEDRIREQELTESIGSSELIPITESNQIEEINSFTVVELKSKLSEMGLKVSGKKSELIERLNQAFNNSHQSQTPSDESIINLENETDVILVDQSAIFDSSVLHEQDAGNGTFHDANPSQSKLRKSLIYGLISRILATIYVLLGLTVIGVFEGWFADFFGQFGSTIIGYAERFYEGYGGMTDTTDFILRIDVAVGFFLAAYWMLTRRAKWTFYVMLFTIPSSILFRIIVAINAGTIDGVLDYGPPLIDVISSVPFLVTAAVPWMATHELGLLPDSEDRGLIHIFDEAEEGLIGDTDNLALNHMDQFAVTRPTPPRRRRPMELFYEGVFLLVSMVLWPLTIGTHFLLALEIPTRYGTWTMEANALTLLVPLYALSLISAWVVVRSDREARGGPLYAKEKEAYQKFMDQFLSLKEAYYERQAKRLNMDDSE